MTTVVMETATEDDGRFVSPTLSLSISRSEFQRRRRLNRPPTAPTHYRRLKKAATAEEDGGDGRFVCSFMEEEPKSVALTSLLSLSTPKSVALNPQIGAGRIRAYDEEKGGGSEIGSLTAGFVDREFDHRVRRSEIDHFWSSNGPRIGEDGALGWSTWLEKELEQRQRQRIPDDSLS
ncbi:hypothetical protein ACS0TY_034445 [Phlomoides rotata]